MSAKQYVDLNGITVYDEEIKDYIDEKGFIAGSGTSGSLAKFSSSGEITDGAALGNDTTKFLRNDGTWAVPPGTGGISSLDDIPDVNISTPSDGQVLKYDSTSSKWINGTGGGGGASTFADLTDTTITSPSTGQVPVYDSTETKWKNKDIQPTLTYAQYLALEAQSLLDPNVDYHISDSNLTAVPVNDSVVSPTSVWSSQKVNEAISYSETEHVVGTWIDGKPLYEMTFVETTPNVTTEGTMASRAIDISTLNVDTVFIAEGFFKDTGNSIRPILYITNSGGQMKSSVTTSSLGMNSNVVAFANCPAYITIRYTKTTDPTPT